MTEPIWAATDQNDRPSLIAVSNTDSTQIVRLTADPATGALLVASAGGGGTGTWYDVSGTIDGVNVTFTLPVTPTSDFLLFLARQPQMLTTDFTVVGDTITYVIAPDASLSGEPHKAFVIS